jgi:hypothetical protein
LARSPALRNQIGRLNDSVVKKFGDEALREAHDEAAEPPKPEETRKARSLRK